jgi:hypothetical protein
MKQLLALDGTPLKMKRISNTKIECVGCYFEEIGCYHKDKNDHYVYNCYRKNRHYIFVAK